MPINDAHCHFLSPRFFELLGAGMPSPPTDPAKDLPARLGWEPPGSPVALAGRWVGELDRHDVGRAALIASLPTDEESVAAAVAAHPRRFVGFFMLDPTRDDAVARVDRGLGELGLRAVCLFPAMHRYPLHDTRVAAVFEAVARHPRSAVFVHCGVLSVGVRKKLGLPSRFETRYGNPIDLQGVALAFPALPMIIPHFGAGYFREALMIADLCPNIYLDTSSSNSWLRYTPWLTLETAFRSALEVAGPDRLLFGTDSSFMPRGWHGAIYDTQVSALAATGVSPEHREQIMGGNFDRLFPLG